MSDLNVEELLSVRVTSASLSESDSMGSYQPQPPPPSPWDAPATGYSGGEDHARRRLVEEIQGTYAAAAAQTSGEERTLVAQATTSSGSTPNVADDATRRDLLIYEAHLGLSVHQVVAKQDQIEALARERGGFLASRTDNTIVIRVPAQEFQRALAAVQELGDVITRRVEVQDVTAEFHDVQQRIRTLEAMRVRVEQMLRDADNVEQALAVEQHLERITVEVEQLRGRLQVLSDRVAYSTITIQFTERAETSAPEFQLPFRWLHSLGLNQLLSI